MIVDEKDIYHFECEIKNDGTMIIRMFEYDVHIALSYMQEKEGCMVVKFPYSAVLYLRDNRNTPDEMTSFYQQIILLLEEEVEAGYLSETNRNTIISLLSKSLIRVFYRNEELLKEVVKLTEPILELEFEKYEKVIEKQARDLQEKDKSLQQKDAEIKVLKKRIAEMECKQA